MAVRSSSEIVGASDNGPRKGMVLPFQPLSLAFNHVNYYVDMPAVSNSFKHFMLWPITLSSFCSC